MSNTNDNIYSIDSTHIIDFIITTSNRDIELELSNVLKEYRFCDKVLGEGFTGTVRIPSIGSYYDIYCGNSMRSLPIVIKESKNESPLEFTQI